MGRKLNYAHDAMYNMNSVNFAVLGDQSVAAGLGKKGTSTDLTLYDRKEPGVVRTCVHPNGFPEKIQPLLQAINLSEYVVMHVDKLDRFAGEQIVALDTLGMNRGILSHSFEVDEGKLDSLVRGTVLESYARVEPGKIKAAADAFEPAGNTGRAKVVIDHCFDVKGVGTVVLGKVASGTIRQYQDMTLLPAGTKVMVKSIQMHDDPVEEASSPARVGLSLKGARPEEVSRGDLLCEDDSVPVSGIVELDFEKNQFYKGGFSEGQMCLVSIGLQIKAAKFDSTSPVRLALDKPAACEPGTTAVILKPESDGIRILGSGTVRS